MGRRGMPDRHPVVAASDPSSQRRPPKLMGMSGGCANALAKGRRLMSTTIRRTVHTAGGGGELTEAGGPQEMHGQLEEHQEQEQQRHREQRHRGQRNRDQWNREQQHREQQRE
ncbi:hypothetical protein VaNZ11_007321, partial [Volvox africanus]